MQAISFYRICSLATHCFSLPCHQECLRNMVSVRQHFRRCMLFTALGIAAKDEPLLDTSS